jgi:Uncharacterized conserved protein (DUF2285)
VPIRATNNGKSKGKENNKKEGEFFFSFGLDGIVQFKETHLSQYYASLSELNRIIPFFPHPLDVYVRIQLHRPLKPQFDVLKKLFKKKENRSPRSQIRKWPLYLRVLDAMDSGASYKEIAQILPGHLARRPQTTRDTVKAATKLRDEWPYWTSVN